MSNDINAVFRAQYGLVGRRQAFEHGLTARQIERRIARGDWLLVRPGVYRSAAVAPSWESALLTWMLGRRAVASHRAAAALWDLDVYNEPRPEITVPDTRRYSDPDRQAVLVHTSSQWHLADLQQRRGIWTTGIERTILDCCGVVGLRTAERLAESAIRQRLTSWTDLASCLMRHSRRGRNGCGGLRRLLELRLGDQTIPLSDFSRLVSNLLIDGGLPAPLVEYPIVASDGSPVLTADLAWPEKRKAWELDGLAYHFGRTDIERDRRKRNRATAEGWVIQEILWSMYIDDPDGLVAMALQFLKT